MSGIQDENVETRMEQTKKIGGAGILSVLQNRKNSYSIKAKKWLKQL